MIEGGFLPQYFEELKAKQTMPVESRRRWNRMEVLSDDDMKDYEVEPFAKVEELGVAVYEIKGAVTKEWYDGTLSLMEQMEYNEANPNCIAHLLDIDSGGGEATNCNTTARFIRGLKKPTMALVNGHCCSAAYYIAAGCQKIYATQNTDIFGSIGCMLSFRDFTKYYKNLGIEEVEIYADQSSEKNLDYKKALKGKYDLIKQSLLNPFAEDFIQTVKELRPTLQDDNHVFKATTYMTNDASQLVLIDGKMTYEAALSELSKEGIKFFNKNTNKLGMSVNMNHKLPGIAAALGMTETEFASVDGVIALPVNLALALESKLTATAAAPAPVAEEKPVAVEDTEVYKNLEAKLTAATSELETIKAGAVVPPVKGAKGDLTDVEPVLSEKAKIAAEWQANGMA